MSTWNQPTIAVSNAQVVGANLSGMEKDTNNGVAVVTRGEDQGKKWNDVGWGFAFLGHLGVMCFFAYAYIPQVADVGDGRLLYSEEDGMGGMFMNKVMTTMTNGIRVLHNNLGHRIGHRVLDEEEADVEGLALLMALTGFVGLFVAISSLGVIMKHAEGFIKAGLYFNCAASLLMCVSGFASGQADVGLIGLLFFAISYCYMRAVWDRIPFAASNLITATSAIRSNMGVTIFALLSIFVMILWAILWATTSYATLYILGECDENFECQKPIGGFTVFLFFVSFFWTVQVIKNVVHVTVAGTVGTWWWSPNEAGSFCSSGVRDSYFRAMTYSFGSICLGSLLVAIIQAIKEMVRKMREQNDSCCACIAECLLGCIQSLIEMFNRWAYVYVGLYGYTFMDAARNVISLFKERGWDAIITDDLVDNVLVLISIGAGIITGAIAAFLSWVLDLHVEDGAFFLGFFLGAGITYVIMGCIGSAVNTVIVCFAEDPNTFKANHPQLSDEMCDSWAKAYPTCFNY